MDLYTSSALMSVINYDTRDASSQKNKRRHHARSMKVHLPHDTVDESHKRIKYEPERRVARTDLTRQRAAHGKHKSRLKRKTRRIKRSKTLTRILLTLQYVKGLVGKIKKRMVKTRDSSTDSASGCEDMPPCSRRKFCRKSGCKWKCMNLKVNETTSYDSVVGDTMVIDGSRQIMRMLPMKYLVMKSRTTKYCRCETYTRLVSRTNRTISSVSSRHFSSTYFMETSRERVDSSLVTIYHRQWYREIDDMYSNLSLERSSNMARLLLNKMNRNYEKCPWSRKIHKFTEPKSCDSVRKSVSYLKQEVTNGLNPLRKDFNNMNINIDNSSNSASSYSLQTYNLKSIDKLKREILNGCPSRQGMKLQLEHDDNIMENSIRAEAMSKFKEKSKSNEIKNLKEDNLTELLPVCSKSVLNLRNENTKMTTNIKSFSRRLANTSLMKLKQEVMTGVSPKISETKMKLEIPFAENINKVNIGTDVIDTLELKNPIAENNKVNVGTDAMETLDAVETLNAIEVESPFAENSDSVNIGADITEEKPIKNPISKSKDEAIQTTPSHTKSMKEELMTRAKCKCVRPYKLWSMFQPRYRFYKSKRYKQVRKFIMKRYGVQLRKRMCKILSRRYTLQRKRPKRLKFYLEIPTDGKSGSPVEPKINLDSSYLEKRRDSQNTKIQIRELGNVSATTVTINQRSSAKSMVNEPDNKYHIDIYNDTTDAGYVRSQMKPSSAEPENRTFQTRTTTIKAQTDDKKSAQKKFKVFAPPKVLKKIDKKAKLLLKNQGLTKPAEKLKVIIEKTKPKEKKTKVIVDKSTPPVEKKKTQPAKDSLQIIKINVKPGKDVEVISKKKTLVDRFSPKGFPTVKIPLLKTKRTIIKPSEVGDVIVIKDKHEDIPCLCHGNVYKSMNPLRRCIQFVMNQAEANIDIFASATQLHVMMFGRRGLFRGDTKFRVWDEKGVRFAEGLVQVGADGFFFKPGFRLEAHKGRDTLFTAKCDISRSKCCLRKMIVSATPTVKIGSVKESLRPNAFVIKNSQGKPILRLAGAYMPQAARARDYIIYSKSNGRSVGNIITKCTGKSGYIITYYGEMSSAEKGLVLAASTMIQMDQHDCKNCKPAQAVGAQAVMFHLDYCDPFVRMNHFLPCNVCPQRPYFNFTLCHLAKCFLGIS